MKKHQPFDMRSRGFTELEALHIGPAKSQWTAPRWLRVVLGLALAVITFHIFILPLIALPEAHAEEPLKTNADYCQEWHAGEWRVVGASADDVAALCAEYL